MKFKKKYVIALIPARRGSKGIERKNIRNVNGKPLISYTIEAAKKALCIDEIHISTNDPEVMSIGNEYSVNIINRPEELCMDSSTAGEVISHFINSLPNLLSDLDPYIIYLQPTSPLRTAKHIDEAYDLMISKNSNSLISIVEMTKSPFKSFLIDDEGFLQSLFKEELTNANRQTLPKVYLPNGAIYIFLVSGFNKNEKIPSNGGVPYLMNEGDSIDIDSVMDLSNLELLMKRRSNA